MTTNGARQTASSTDVASDHSTDVVVIVVVAEADIVGCRAGRRG